LHNGDILVTLDQGTSYLRLPAGGGEPGAPQKVDAGDYRGTLVPISVLPEDRGVLMNGVSYGARGWYYSIALLDPASGKVRFLLDDGGSAVYARTGHLLFTRGDVLLAAPFDLGTLSLTGSPVPIMNGLWTRFVVEPARFFLGDNGTLYFRPGGAVLSERRLATVDADGNVTPWTEERQAYAQQIALSRDGRRFAVTITNGRGLDEIWVSDFDRPALRRTITVPDADCHVSAMSPDGQMVAFTRTGRDDKDGIYVQRADGQGEARRVLTPPSRTFNLSVYEWSPDGSAFLSGVLIEGRLHIRVQKNVLAPGAPPEPKRLIAGFVDDFSPSFSPDGRMMAFASNESGRTEVYVGAYGADGSLSDPVRVSSGGGNLPNWMPDGKHLLYVAPPRRLMSVPIHAGGSITSGPPTQVADLDRLRIVEPSVLPDGRLFGVLTSDMERNEVTEGRLVINFFDLLERRMAGAGNAAGR
jgi:eukaryotic-like serine/threonine-protein kinase